MRTEELDSYKHKEYKRLGFTDYQARRLLEAPGLDVGSVRKIIEQGCTVKLAYRIYRP